MALIIIAAKTSNLPPSHQINPQITLHQTKQIHSLLLKTQFQYPLQILPNSFQLPATLPARYNFIITCYNKNNQPKPALNIYAQMRALDIEVDSFTIPSILKSCAHISWVQIGREIHGFALKNGLGYDVFVGNALIQLYGECGYVVYARQLFDNMSERDAVSWSTMIKSYAKHRMLDDAIGMIRDMHSGLVKASEVAMISMVNVLADIANVKAAKAMHAYVIKNTNTVQLGTYLTTSLIDLYAKSGSLALARCLFDGLNQKGIVSYTAMIAGYIRRKELDEGIKLFRDMIARGIWPNEVSLLSLIPECGVAGDLDLGKQLHAYVLRSGFALTLSLATSLLDMYGKCSQVSSACAIFDSMDKKDVMTWTALISAYAKENRVDEAIDLLILMRDNHINPNQVTMASLVSLCAEAGALDRGKWIHAYIDKQAVELDVVLRTALIDMYASCGDIAGAYNLFDEATRRDITMWNAMINGFAIHGHGEDALKIFSRMECSKVEPNDITFIGLLYACSHAGMVVEGKKIFENMVSIKYSVAPKIEHYGCMVDLLGRARMVDEAYIMIQNMPMKPNVIVWSALLASCKVHRKYHPNLGEVAARELLRLDPENCGYNVLISNMYATENRWTAVSGVRTSMENRGMKKEPGLSCIEINGSVHKFVMGDKSHLQYEEIDDMLGKMMKKLREVGYKPDTYSGYEEPSGL